MTYKFKINSLSKNNLSSKDFSKLSFCPKDYLILKESENVKDLKIFIDNYYKGDEIGSDNYVTKSKYRFLKTVNISESYLVDFSTIEYCKPSSLVPPSNGDILIVKDGLGRGLGEVCLYSGTKENIDYLASGVICLKIESPKKFYIFSLLKSQHFKDFVNINTAQGSTLRHSKFASLEYKVPFPSIKNYKDPVKLENYISILTKIIIEKEKQIIVKRNQINEVIEKELLHNQKSNYEYSYPTIQELRNTRFDTGLYSKRFRDVEVLINNYSKGYFKINLENFKSGSTPKTRIFNSKYESINWVTPTYINDDGFYDSSHTIRTPKPNNINKNCLLIINRTSKGKKGEYVGISCFYDIDSYGKGFHNQGIYRIENMHKDELIFLSAMLNSKIYRKICGSFSIGSKMKEMKSIDFSNIKFPNFGSDVKDEIIKLYYNPLESNFSFSNDLYEIELNRNKSIGLFQLYYEINQIKNIIESLIKKIIYSEPVEL